MRSKGTRNSGMRLSRERSHLRGLPFRSPAFDLPSAKAGEASEDGAVLSPATRNGWGVKKSGSGRKSCAPQRLMPSPFGISRKAGNASNHEIKHDGFRIIA